MYWVRMLHCTGLRCSIVWAGRFHYTGQEVPSAMCTGLVGSNVLSWEVPLYWAGGSIVLGLEVPLYWAGGSMGTGLGDLGSIVLGLEVPLYWLEVPLYRAGGLLYWTVG